MASFSFFTGRMWEMLPEKKDLRWFCLKSVKYAKPVGCCLWGRTESDTTEATYSTVIWLKNLMPSSGRLWLELFHLSLIFLK